MTTTAVCAVAPVTEGLMNVWWEIWKPDSGGVDGDVIVAQHDGDQQQNEVAL